MRLRRIPYPEQQDDGAGPISDGLAAVNDRLDQLTQQLARMSDANVDRHTDATEQRAADRVAEALARLDRRLGRVCQEERAAEFARPLPPQPAPSQPVREPVVTAPSAQARGSSDWATQIAARQRALDDAARVAATAAAQIPAVPPAPVAPAAPIAVSPSAPVVTPTPPIPARSPATPAFAFAPLIAARSPAPVMAAPPLAPPVFEPADLSGLEQQLRQLNSQISALQQPYEEGLIALRNDLSEIGRALHEAMPRRAIEALESDVHALAELLDRSKQAGADNDALGTLEHGLEEVRDALRSLMPAENLIGFEETVRALANKVDQIAAREGGQDPTALKQLEQAVVSLRGVVSNVASNDTLAQLAAEVHALAGQFERAAADSGANALQETVRALANKVDQIAARDGGQDPTALRQLEQAVVSLRGVVSNVASDDALAQLAGEVRALAGKFERAATDSDANVLDKLEARIAALIENKRTMPPELEGSIRTLNERLDRLQLSQGDQLALVALEDRIAKLSEKLDASDARLRHLDAIERGLADLLVYLQDMRDGGARGPRAAAAPVTAPVPPPASESPPPSPLDFVPGLPAPATVELPGPLSPLPPSVPTPPPVEMARAPDVRPALAPMPMMRPAEAPSVVDFNQSPTARLMPRTQNRPPIEPGLPPDTPLEPGSRVPRGKPGSSAAARIAASEAALGHARPAPTEHPSRSDVVAAARNAAKAAYLDMPVNVPPTLRGRTRAWFKWRSRKEPNDFGEAVSRTFAPPSPANDLSTDMPLSRGKRAVRFAKTLLIAASVAVIVVGAAQTAFELLWPDNTAVAPKVPERAPPAPIRPMSGPDSGLRPAPAAPQPAPGVPPRETINSIDPGSSMFDPPAVPPPKPAPPDVTGSIVRPPLATRPQAAVGHPSGDSLVEALPASIGPALRTAAANSNPAAEYELGARYAEGRGVPQNLPESIRWFERAANAGFAPAQFRLGSLHEKGDGLKKDLQAARRFYLAAAGKGHAKAMHNLGVLYAEGIDGKPNYKAAAQWFRKAAGYGVTDSQYNLAILYARGIGVEANLAESYQWFALAAANGDTDAAKKRDEVAARLAPQDLTAAKLAVQGFVPEREPEEATSLKAPPGGWDRTPAAAPKPQRRDPAPTAR